MALSRRPSQRPGSQADKQRFDFGAGQKRHDPLVEPLWRDVEHALDEVRVLGMLQRRIGEERADRGQPEVTGPDAVAAFFFQVVEEGGDHVRGQVSPVQLLRSRAGFVLDEDEQQTHRVAV